MDKKEKGLIASLTCLLHFTQSIFISAPPTLRTHNALSFLSSMSELPCLAALHPSPTRQVGAEQRGHWRQSPLLISYLNHKKKKVTLSIVCLAKKNCRSFSIVVEVYFPEVVASFCFVRVLLFFSLSFHFLLKELVQR